MKEYRYLTIEDAIDFHKRTVAISGGGSDGILDTDKLASVLDHIQNDIYYPEFEDKAAHLFFCTNKFHCFADGNKRLSIVLTGQFFSINGYMYCLGRFYTEMENISVYVADGKIDKDLLHELICGIIVDDFDNEQLKLKYLTAICS
jgi:death-on-curing protein